MNKKAESMVNFAIGVVIFAVLATVLYSVISDSTDYQTVTKEPIKSNATILDTLAHDDLVSGSVTIYNNTGPYANGTLAASEYVLVLSTGVINVTQSQDNKNLDYNISYSYRSDSYIKEGTTRSVAGYISVLFVVALLAYVGYAATA